MSVLSCSRRYCPNIMCDRRSSDHGYLCNECFKELVALGSDTDIHEFMRSEPKPKIEKPDSFTRWDKEFPTY